ncbi:MAG: M23 family metallopeptidase [Maledivibacter sp.]|jgi:murein DD-endopeptidase MepM/ murein hydrolase activator NlpD|nr:M23 family metallopeptidase [Maledivibacter sp.]
MDKSYRRNMANRQRKSYYGYSKYKSKMKNNKSSSIYRRVLTQILVSILVVLLIIIFKSINTPLTNNTTSMIKEAMYAQFDYKDSIDQLKEYAVKIKDYTVKAVPVFNRFTREVEMARPIEGVVISSYGENYNSITEKNTFQRGINVKAINMKIVKSADDGVVEMIGESESLGKFVKISHGEDIFSIYSNLDRIFVKEKESIIRGQRIGELGGLQSSYLHFELWIDNDAVDPQLYMDYSVTGI